MSKEDIAIQSPITEEKILGSNITEEKVLSSGITTNLVIQSPIGEESEDAPPIPTEGLIWRVEGGTITDLSGSGYNGILSANPPTLTNGINGEANGAFDFVSANSQDITFPSIVEFVNVQQFSICTWFKRSSTSNQVVIGNFLDGTHGTALTMFGTTINTPIRNGGVTQYVSANTIIDEWVSIMLIWDGTQAVDADKISQYVNNVKVGSVSGPVPTFSANNSAPFIIGSLLGGFDDGQIAQNLGYNRVLNASERTQIFAQKIV